MNALASNAFTHSHSLSYLHAIGSGWANRTDRYGCEWGVCRDCGRDITRLVEEGVKPRDNRHPFRTSEELELIEAAHAEAGEYDAELIAYGSAVTCTWCGEANHRAQELADCPNADPAFAIETWNEAH